MVSKKNNIIVKFSSSIICKEEMLRMETERPSV